MITTVCETYFVLRGAADDARRFYAGPTAVIPELSAAMRFISREAAERRLPEASALSRMYDWQVVRVEQTARLVGL